MDRNSLQEKIMIIAALLTSLAFLLAGSNFGLSIYDEGISLTGAMRVAHGQIPYIDFWTMYPPGEFYLLAGFMNLAGWSIMAERILSVFIMLGSALAALGLARKISNSRAGLLTMILIIAFTGSYQYFARAVSTSMLFTAISLFFIAAYFKDGKSYKLVLSAVLCALTAMFRLDLGAYLFIAESTGLAADIFIKNDSDRRSPLLKRQKIIRLVHYISIVAVILVATLIYLGSYVPYEKLWLCLVYTPARIFPAYRSLPLPVRTLFNSQGHESTTTVIRLFWESVVFFIPLAVCLASARLVIKSKRLLSRHVLLSLTVIIATGILFHAQALVRSDMEHLVPAFFISAILLAFLPANMSYSKRWRQALVFAVLFVVSVPLLKKFDSIKHNLSKSGNYQFLDGRAKGIILPREWGESYDRQLRFITSRTRPDEKIFVANKDNDKIVINDVIFYFLAGRLPGSYYHELHPGVVNDLGTARNPIETDLRKNSVRYVILYDQGEVSEPNKSNSTTDSNHLDNFISNNYVVEKQFGSYTIMKTTSYNLVEK